MIHCLILWYFLFSVIPKLTPEPQSRTRHITKVKLHLRLYYNVCEICATACEILYNVLALNRRTQQQEMILKVKYTIHTVKSYDAFINASKLTFSFISCLRRIWRVGRQRKKNFAMCITISAGLFSMACCTDTHICENLLYYVYLCFCRSTQRGTLTLAALNQTTLGLAQLAA